MPNNIEVDAEVSVDKSVSHGHDCLPGDLRRLQSSGLGHLGSRFADNLDVFDQREDQLAVGLQVGPVSTASKRHGFTGRLQHMAQPDFVIPVHTAPRPPQARPVENSDSDPQEFVN